MLLANVMKGSDQAALEDREEPSTVFVWFMSRTYSPLGMVHDTVTLDVGLCGPVGVQVVRQSASSGRVHMALNRTPSGCAPVTRGIGKATNADRTRARLARRPASCGSRPRPSGLVGGPCEISASRPRRFRPLPRCPSISPWQRPLSHRIAEPMRHEPSRLVGDAEHAVELVRAHALLGRCTEGEVASSHL